MSKNCVGSIFEVFRAGPGPSSSHTMGPQRATVIFLKRLDHTPAKLRVILFGSLAETGDGHLTDKAIISAASGLPVEVCKDLKSTDLPHPNTMRFEALDENGSVFQTWTVSSVGGGSLEDSDGPVAPEDQFCYTLKSMEEAIKQCTEAGCSFSDFVSVNERDIEARLKKIWTIMKESVERGLKSSEAFLPGPLGLRRRAPATFSQGQHLQSPQKDLALISSFALAVAEENASGRTIVTAPTCGSCGVLPGVLYYFETVRKVPAATILKALATAGLFGAVIRANASISGAEVGCQGEIGSACSMAAAAAAQMLGGTLQQIEYAAEIAMEHHLGLTCDPVEGYVQVPCIERNMAAALRAFECASFAMLTDGKHLISFDGVVEAMNETGRDLQSAYRETARGGLALLWRKRKDRPAG